ncbi:hypothetical protein CARUB_v10012635mg [Capsella rubella]|uniref:Protein kinase domain-containing protein n=1 Tax=Capsella rubella TaxID=81985 RepID=R0I632_9BRAS|nr:hypothetical protein CARUB_v10012635mg [Capsella rubella]
MERHFVYVATFLLILHLVQAQNQTGFISVDCGLSPLASPYDETETGLTYTSDANLVNSGKIGKIATEFEPFYDRPALILRYFPEGLRNCYNLNVTRDTKYLIKATFVYGNYDGLNVVPNFDLYLGPNLWTTVCLVNTGISIPFINMLELRPMKTNMYVTESGSLKRLFRRYISNSSTLIRFPDDVYDRKWHPLFKDSWAPVTTNLIVNTGITYTLPQGVMATAGTPLKANDTMGFTWTVEPPTTQYYAYMHFAEIQTLRANDTREFNVTQNGIYTFGPFSPLPLKTASISNLIPQKCDEGTCIVQVVKTLKSTLPPILNAIEAFSVIDFPQTETNGEDVAGIKNVQDTYGLNRISWQGDPCVPKLFLWDGLNCSISDNSTPPIITSLDLSSSGLTGIITHAIQNLTHLQKLNLSGNNLSGSVPPSLLQKKGIKLNVEGNPNLVCTAGSCMNKGDEGHKKKSVIVPVIASIASIAVLIGALVLFFILRKKKSPKAEVPPPSYMQASSQPAIVAKNRRFTYSQVVTMTNNFQRILGKGGFGIVYHGFVNGTEQVELLLRVHHKNLVGLVGYCDEGESLALIYEYMANGDLKEHMSGLEYLHNGCKPPMVHRDVKTTNILLTEHFQAKLADFGLSRSFPTEGETHVSTVVAGTPGYLDPEYYRTNWLTEKSDVYSFGIVLLEIITNQPVIDKNRENPHIAEWAGVMLTKGDIKSIMDPSLNEDYESASVWKAVELAMGCLNPNSVRRPTMSQVVVELNECLASEKARGGASRDMESKSSIEVSLTFDTEVSPTAR